MRRWWVYQRERFPLIRHSPLIAAFSAAAVGYSSMLPGPNGAKGNPTIAAFAVAFAVCLLLFLQLRIADEFKDFEEDSRWRPYRPVPRGLVSLRELAVLGIAAAAAQAVAAAWLRPGLLVLLGVTWVYLALMTREFFVGAWLRPRPVPYMITHMAILPLVDLFATACDWMTRPEVSAAPPAGLLAFLLTSYFNGFVIEIGRKVRAPADEEEGVETYSALWGYRRAAGGFLAVVAVTGALAVWAAGQVGTAPWVGAVVATLWIGAAVVVRRFIRSPRQGAGGAIEAASGVWTLGMYTSLGLVPLALRSLE